MERPVGQKRRRPIRWGRVIAAVVIIVAAGGVVASRLLPRSPVSPTEAMRAASRALSLEHAGDQGVPSPPSNPTTQRERLLVAAYAMRGVPYEWGAKGPETLDCSGFTKAAYAAVGVRLPDGSFNQARHEKPLDSIGELAPGDLLFYRWNGADGVSHVTLYAGDGWAIGTGSPGQPKEVVVYPLSDDQRVPGTVITYRHIQLSDED